MKQVWHLDILGWAFSATFGRWGKFRAGWETQTLKGRPFAGGGALPFVAFTVMHRMKRP